MTSETKDHHRGWRLIVDKMPGAYPAAILKEASQPAKMFRAFVVRMRNLEPQTRFTLSDHHAMTPEIFDRKTYPRSGISGRSGPVIVRGKPTNLSIIRVLDDV